MHKRALAFFHNAKGGRAFSVGCGCNTGFTALMHECQLKIEGIDLSKCMVAFARTASPKIAVHHGALCYWQPQYVYQFISAWDSI